MVVNQEKGYPNVQNPLWSTFPRLNPLQNVMMAKSTITSEILKLHDVALIQGQKLMSSNRHAVLGIVVKCMIGLNGEG